MARTILYCCDTFVAGQRDRLAVGEHKELKTAGEVIRPVERGANKARDIGPMAYEMEADHESEDDSEPKVLVRVGRTPDE